MINCDTAHWTVFDGKIGLLMFAQSLEELTAPYSHDSHRVPALNFHFICYEMLNVIDLIDDNVLDKGNLIPLYAEMKELFLHDEVAQNILGKKFEPLFFKKNTKGEYEQRPLKIDSSKDIDDNIHLLKKGLGFIIGELDRKNQYYQQLIAAIKEKISCCGDDLLKLEPIRILSKIYASELINRGYSQYYIYDCVKFAFFSPATAISSVDDIDVFFNFFSKKSNEYCVYMPLNSVKQKRAIESYNLFEIEENIYEMFDPGIPFILKYKCEAPDPYSAREDALQLVNFCLSVNHFIKHTSHDFNSKYADVVDTETHKVTFIKKPEPLITRGGSICDDLDVNELLTTCLNLRGGALQVLQLHSSALISKNNDNQLINLWTALEVAVPVGRKEGLSRVNQISNVLTAALSRNYLDILSNQLLSEIKSVNPRLVELINGIDLEGDSIFKLVSILVLSQYQNEFDTIVQQLIYDVPLLAYRFIQYKNAWSSTKALKSFYLSHTTRVSQQIMRIYRTRNMLVHDGSSLPYADYVLQNLHYYVDLFIKVLNQYYRLGYRSINLIAEAVQFQEYQYLENISEEYELCKEMISKYIFRDTIHQAKI